VTKTYREVDARLFAKYIDIKASPVIGALEQNMNIGMFDWATVYPVIGLFNLQIAVYCYCKVMDFRHSLQYSIVVAGDCFFVRISQLQALSSLICLAALRLDKMYVMRCTLPVMFYLHFVY
jgi:hypothetical protein